MTSISSSIPLAKADPREPFWTRIASDLADAIVRGAYRPGDRLPSENVLAEQFGVHRHTIRKSLASLCSKGLVRSTQGSGTYVEDFAVDLVLAKRTRHQHNLSHAGLKGGLRVLRARTTRATKAQASALQITPRSKLLLLDVLGEAEGVPLHVSERVFPLPRFAGLDAVVAETGSITEAFRAAGVADYTRRESRITAHLPDPEVAAHLRQPPSRPVLRVESVNVDTAGVPIEFAVTWFAGDRVHLVVAHHD
jgi:GntR family phosphonate transport system transcriptional regulator